LARSLVTGSTGNIGVIVPDITNPFFAPFLSELESALGERDVGLLMGNSRESPEHEHRLVRRMSTQVDGLVLASSRLADEQILQVASRLPVVLANREIGGRELGLEGLSQVLIDVQPGFHAAVAHLHGLGHRRLSYLDGPSRSWSAGRKRASLEAACAELGVRLTVHPCERPDFGAGYAIGRRLLSAVETVDLGAVLTYNDQVALGVLAAAQEAGVDVPGQVSLVGCDNALPEGLARPPLTTIDSSSRDLGALAAAAVLDPGRRTPAPVPTRLVVRSSTGPAATLRPAGRR
jgi:LacI family transcriptional regulator